MDRPAATPSLHLRFFSKSPQIQSLNQADQLFLHGGGEPGEGTVDRRRQLAKEAAYSFISRPSSFTKTVFASYLERTVHFMELPGENPSSELHFLIEQRRALHFAWLSGAGIYHGGLNFGASHSSQDGDENFVENKALLDYSKLSEGGELVKPSSLAGSEFHFLLLIGNKFKVVNKISEQIKEELHFDLNSDSSSRGILGLCSDATAGLFYAYDQNSIFQVSVNDEGRDMWKVYLDMEYAAALANCRNALQRDKNHGWAPLYSQACHTEFVIKLVSFLRFRKQK